MSYTQNREEEFILKYLGDKGVLLDLGANDGRTFSNSLRLIQKGWKAVLVEASPTIFKRLKKEHHGNKNVQCLNMAIGKKNEKVTFYESGTLLGKGDHSLVSTIDPEELKRWKGIEFNKIEMPCYTYDRIKPVFKWKNFDFISIDVEGLDYDILAQIDLLNVKMVIVEFNGKEPEKYVRYCKGYGLREVHRNGENLIFIRQ